MRKNGLAVSDKTVLLSIHDISPVYEEAVVETCDQLQDLGIDSYSLLVTPIYELKKSNSFANHDLFAGYLGSLNLDVSMHGYSHISKSKINGEFEKIPYDRILSRLRLGYNLIQRSFKIKPNGFVPHLWKAPSTLRKAVNELGINYCVINNTLFDLTRDLKFTTAHRLVSHGDSIPSLIDGLLEIELGGALQISLHPTDYVSDKMFDLLVDLKDRLGYKFLSYSDFLHS